MKGLKMGKNKSGNDSFKEDLDNSSWLLDIAKNFEKWKNNYTNAEQTGILEGEHVI